MPTDPQRRPEAVQLQTTGVLLRGSKTRIYSSLILFLWPKACPIPELDISLLLDESTRLKECFSILGWPYSRWEGRLIELQCKGGGSKKAWYFILYTWKYYITKVAGLCPQLLHSWKCQKCRSSKDPLCTLSHQSVGFDLLLSQFDNYSCCLQLFFNSLYFVSPPLRKQPFVQWRRGGWELLYVDDKIRT